MLGVSAATTNIASPSTVSDGKVVVGRRLHHRTSWRAQFSPTRPEQPSLTSVGGGMAAGARLCRVRARTPSSGRRSVGSVRGSFCTSGNANVPYIHTTSRRVYTSNVTDRDSRRVYTCIKIAYSYQYQQIIILNNRLCT